LKLSLTLIGKIKTQKNGENEAVYHKLKNNYLRLDGYGLFG
jgi:hypothetical protein